RVVDVPEATGPRLRTVSVTENVAPGALAGAGGFMATDISTRSAVATVTTAVGVARQLFASSLSATALPSSAQASRKYLSARVVVGTVTVAVAVWLAPASRP